MKIKANARRVHGLLFPVFLMSSPGVLAIGHSHVLVGAGMLAGDISVSGMIYLEQYSKLNATKRKDGQTKLLAELDQFTKMIESLKCPDDVYATMNSVHAQLSTSPPSDLYLKEPSMLSIPLLMDMQHCVTFGVDFDYYVLGMEIGQLQFLLTTNAAQDAAEFDGEILDSIGRLNRISASLLAQKEFPEDAALQLKGLLKIFESQQGKNNLSKEVRGEIRARTTALAKIFANS